MQIDPDTFYPEQADSPILDVIGKRSTRAVYRCKGKGPAYIKIGSRVTYKGADILSWLNSQRIEPRSCAA